MVRGNVAHASDVRGQRVHFLYVVGRFESALPLTQVEQLELVRIGAAVLGVFDVDPSNPATAPSQVSDQVMSNETTGAGDEDPLLSHRYFLQKGGVFARFHVPAHTLEQERRSRINRQQEGELAYYPALSLRRQPRSVGAISLQTDNNERSTKRTRRAWIGRVLSLVGSERNELTKRPVGGTVRCTGRRERGTMAMNPKAAVSCLLVGVLTVGALPLTALGATPVIRHTPSECPPASSLPQFTVEIEGEIESSWLNFRCTRAGDEEWFKVPLEKVGDGIYVGTAPTPDPASCQAFEYTVDATAADMQQAVTPTYRVPVSYDGCGDGGVVPSSASSATQDDDDDENGAWWFLSNPLFWGGVGGGSAFSIYLATRESSSEP